MADKLRAALVTGELTYNEKLVDFGDGSYGLKVVAVNESGTAIGAGTVDRELVVSTYLCKTAFTGASVGDTITSTQILDVTATPSTVSVVWRNQTTAADLAGAPSASAITLLASTALTDAQLRATSVPVLDKNGKAGVTITTGTGAVTGTFTAIQCITDTVFTTLTETGATGSLGSTIVPAGMTLFGNFTAYTLASGVVRAYA